MDEFVSKKIQDCINRAEDLIRSAKRVLISEDLPNISFFLSILALEEIGKAEILAMCAIFKAVGKPYDNQLKRTHDHVGKIFWALWHPRISSEHITGEQIGYYQGLARDLFKRRNLALYVDCYEGKVNGGSQSTEDIEKEEAESMIDLVQARISLAKEKDIAFIDSEPDELIEWFFMITEDDRKRNQIFGDFYLSKLKELGSVREWLGWLKDWLEKEEEAVRQVLVKEINRKAPQKGEGISNKWEITIRLQTLSHSIRPKTLKLWNDKVDSIQIAPVRSGKNEIDVKFILREDITVDSLYYAGWGMARMFVTAINIGTMGLFWWYVPRDIDRYFIKVKDLQLMHEIEMGIRPKLQLDWEKHQRAFSEQDIENTILSFIFIPSSNERNQQEPFTHYINGLAFMCKNDIYLRFEANAYFEFYKSLKKGMELYADWNPSEDYLKAFTKFMFDLKPDASDFEKYVAYGELLEKQVETPQLTLEDVAMMKALCDWYFMRQFMRMAEDRALQEIRTDDNDNS